MSAEYDYRVIYLKSKLRLCYRNVTRQEGRVCGPDAGHPGI